MKTRLSSRAKRAHRKLAPVPAPEPAPGPIITAAQRFASIPEMLLALFTSLDSFTTFHNLRLVSRHFNNLAVTHQTYILRSIAHTAFPPHIHHLLNLRRPNALHPLTNSLWTHNLGHMALSRNETWHTPLLFHPDLDPRPDHFSLATHELQHLEYEDTQLTVLAKALAREIPRTSDWDDNPSTVLVTKKLVKRIKVALYLLFYLLTQFHITGIEGVPEDRLNSLSSDELAQVETERLVVTYDFSAAEQLGMEGLTRVINLARMLTTLGRDAAFREGFPGRDVLSCEAPDLGGWGGVDLLYERASVKVFAALCVLDYGDVELEEEEEVECLVQRQRCLFEDLYFHPKDFRREYTVFLGMKKSGSGLPVFVPGGQYNERVLERRMRMVLEADGVWREKEVLEMREDWASRVTVVESKLINGIAFESWEEVALEEQDEDSDYWERPSEFFTAGYNVLGDFYDFTM